jgi:hypothetical protein
VWSGLDDLLALSKLTLLTKLQLTPEWYEQMGSLPPGAAFTALTASTHLCSLELGLRCWNVPQDCQLFKPGSLYPHLHTINLLCEDTEDSMALGQQQLQQLCSCCPAVESLSFSLHEPLLTAASPLYQLSALTRLKVNQEVAAAEAAAEAAAAAAVTASVVDVAVQLTGLKQLELWGLPQLRLPALLQLSSLTGLQGLTLHGDHAHMAFKNQVCAKERGVCEARQCAGPYRNSMLGVYLGQHPAAALPLAVVLTRVQSNMLSAAVWTQLHVEISA